MAEPFIHHWHIIHVQAIWYIKLYTYMYNSSLTLLTGRYNITFLLYSLGGFIIGKIQYLIELNWHGAYLVSSRGSVCFMCFGYGTHAGCLYSGVTSALACCTHTQMLGVWYTCRVFVLRCDVSLSVLHVPHTDVGLTAIQSHNQKLSHQKQRWPVSICALLLEDSIRHDLALAPTLR